ncbi:hypothetical protein KFU94_27610 [Chloroflexi bacterium TSY]|nr:hypothetical protein [Chloroflexi bacterium TSY]
MTEATAFFSGLQFWISFALALMVFSVLFGENILSRLAHYILVGASFGYLAVLLLQNVLRQRLIIPLMRDPLGDWGKIGLLFFSLILLFAGIWNLFQSSSALYSQRNVTKETRTGRRLRVIGMIPVALIVGVTLATMATGTIQGTLLPQFMRAAQTGFAWSASPSMLLSSIVMLLITTGVLLHLYVDIHPTRKISSSRDVGSVDAQNQVATYRQPETDFFTLLVVVWSWLGKRALWFAAGIIFARLVMSRLSLLIAQLEFWLDGMKGMLPWS